jgi:hypothetical protein
VVSENPLVAVVPFGDVARSAAAGPDNSLKNSFAKTPGHGVNLADWSGQHNQASRTFSTSQFCRNTAQACCLDAGTAICIAQRYYGNNEGGMTTFDKREEGFEKKFAHDEELRFKAMARRNKLLGLWAAEVLGKSGPDADAYAKEVVMADFEETGDNDVLRKIAKDLQEKGITEQQIRTQMNELLKLAVDQIKASG